MNITAQIVRITETEMHVDVAFRLTNWETESPLSTGDEPLSESAEPGQPGAWWAFADAPEFAIRYPRGNADRFDVGRSYVLALTEIIDAPISEFEEA